MSIGRNLHPEERARLLAELKTPRDRLLVLLPLNSGLRVSSALSLRWHQLWRDGDVVDMLEVPRRHLKGGKGKHKRSVSSQRIPINEVLRGAILEHLREEFGALPPPADAWVFRSRNRSPGVLSRQQVHAIVTEAASRAGLGLGVAPHSLRRTYATQIYEVSGHCLLSVMRLLGHQSPVTTSRYIRPEQEALDALVLGLPFRASGAGTPAPEPVAQTCISGT